MSSQTTRWSALVNEANLMIPMRRDLLNSLEELVPLTYCPELAPSSPIILLGSWLLRCQREGLISDAERTALITSITNVHCRRDRLAFTAMADAKRIVTCSTNWVQLETADGNTYRFEAVNQAQAFANNVRVMLEASKLCQVFAQPAQLVANDDCPSFPHWLPLVKIVLLADSSEHIGMPVIDKNGGVTGILEGDTFIPLSWA